MADWSKQRWIKLYTHDSLTWLSWPWETRAVFLLLLRKVDADGTLKTEGMQPWDAVSILTGCPVDVARSALEHMERTGTARLSGDAVQVINFAAAQKARTSNAERQRRHRESQRVTPSNDEREEIRKDTLDIYSLREEQIPRHYTPAQVGLTMDLLEECFHAGVSDHSVVKCFEKRNPIQGLQRIKAAHINAEPEPDMAGRTRRELEASRVPDEERASPEQIGAILDRLKQKTSTSDPKCGKQ